MINRLALGTAQLGQDYGIANKVGQISFGEAKESLFMALLNGVDTLDTAISYGDSEAVMGKIGIEKFRVITKLPEVPKSLNVRSWITSQLKLSLSRLSVNSVYGLLLHRPWQLKGQLGNEILLTLEELKQSGIIKKIGISIYDPEDLDGLPLKAIDIVQAPYNIFDRRLFASGAAAKLKDLGIELHARSIFLQGLLLIPREDRPVKFLRWSDHWLKWDSWLDQQRVSALRACMSFALSRVEIDRVIVGFDSTSQLKEILEIAKQDQLKSYPNFDDVDINLINPSNWSTL